MKPENSGFSAIGGKMKILYLPFDERPCNKDFPCMLENDNLKILTCEKNILGNKKIPGNIYEIQNFLINNCQKCDYAVISLDTLLYGGLLPSRLHHDRIDLLQQRFSILQKIKKCNPSIKIFTFQCIMRCPQYNSSEEEPDYYEQYGLSIFRQKYLLDKKERDSLSIQEEEELQSIHIPEDILQDYVTRRKINLEMNKAALRYLQEDTIDFHVIPQDDSSPFGYTAIDQKCITIEIQKMHLQQKTMLYPGADEVGQSLITRAYNAYYKKCPKIYAYYASILGPTIIPKYEDRPMFESLKSHIRVTGAILTRSANNADIFLAINSPGKFMQESFEKNKDISYSSFRELQSFVDMIKEDCAVGRKVILADCAYANGGDLDFIHALDAYDLLDKIYAYGGWNTHCNTLGTVLSIGQIATHVPLHTIIYRIIEDCFYQADIRQRILEKDLPELGLSYYDFKDKENIVANRISKALLQSYDTLQLSKSYPISSIEVTMPWHRMFEIGLQIHD